MGCSASQPRGSVTRRLEGLSASAARELLLRELRQGLAADEPDSSGELPLAAVLRLDQPCPALEVLLKAGASTSDSHIADALFARLRLQRPENRKTVQLLLESGLDANSADSSPGCSRDTLLVASVRAGEDGLVEDLLAAGADVNGADQHGNTALHVAAAKASEAVAECLLQRGASATVKNADGHSAVLSARLGAIAPSLRLSAAGGWASKEVLSAKVAGKLDARVLDVGEEVWRCPISKECWTGSASPPTAPRNHQVAAMLAQAAGDAYSLADAVEGAWLAGQAPPMKSQEEVHPAIMQCILMLVQVLQQELRAALEVRDRERLSAGLEMLRYAKVAQLPEEEPAIRTLVAIELEAAIAARKELELKQAILSAQQYEQTGSRLYKDAEDALQTVLEEKRVEQIGRQLADAAARGDLEMLHSLLQAGKTRPGGSLLTERPEFSEAEVALKKGVCQSLQRAIATCSRKAVRKACAEAERYGYSDLPEYMRLVDFQRQLCLQNLQDAMARRDQEALRSTLQEMIEQDADVNAWAGQEPKFQEAIKVYKELLGLPPYFENEQVLSKISKSSVKKELLQNTLCEVFQELLDATYRRVRTKDRRGDVPSRLIVKEAVVVKNLPNFVEYVRRREEIRKECQERPHPATLLNQLESRSVCKTFAALPSGKPFHQVWRESHDLPNDPVDAGINEFYLFHGTKPSSALAIAEGDFRLDLAGSNAGTLYGRGLYFSESTGKSDEYATEDSRGLCCMLVCRVTLGRLLYTDEEYPNTNDLVRRCTRGENHSVLGDREKIRNTFREMIVYDTHQAYPEFVVWYSREM